MCVCVCVCAWANVGFSISPQKDFCLAVQNWINDEDYVGGNLLLSNELFGDLHVSVHHIRTGRWISNGFVISGVFYRTMKKNQRTRSSVSGVFCRRRCVFCRSDLTISRYPSVMAIDWYDFSTYCFNLTCNCSTTTGRGIVFLRSLFPGNGGPTGITVGKTPADRGGRKGGRGRVIETEVNHEWTNEGRPSSLVDMVSLNAVWSQQQKLRLHCIYRRHS